MITIPNIPDPVDGGRCEGKVPLRFEDVAQDGHLLLTAIPTALGAALWPAVMVDPVNAASFQAGIIPILSRMLLVGGGAPISIFHPPLSVEGAWHNAHVAGPDGNAERLLLMMWASLHGREGWAHLHTPPGAPVLAGQIYAEHILTRLFAAPEERRVTRVDLPGRPAVPPSVWPWRTFEAVTALPEGATVLAQRERSFVFGMGHTDSNQHVNSLVYPRLFEEFALGLAAELGRDASDLLSRRCEILWRKPFFAGETATISLVLYELDGKLGAAGSFGVQGRGRCALHTVF